MPPEKRRATDVRFTPEFKRNLRHLAKKYRHIRSDVQPIINARRGKRGGYRLIYC
ncbi:MAG: mRNA-degrading endonuclease RelE of RelBE toxin-antitoxin system [Rhodothermales bacterium]|jgi:mRNA-degrading endonuclease RelE of RelBE toxin-antitoxin system